MSKCENCTKVNCSLTGCVFNSACCVNPSNTNTYCTLKEISLKIDEETGILDCCQYNYDYEKPYECMDCQMDKYGGVELEDNIEFIKVDNIEDLFE